MPYKLLLKIKSDTEVSTWLETILIIQVLGINSLYQRLILKLFLTQSQNIGRILLGKGSSL